MPPIKLIVTDLDGTLMGSRDEYEVYTPFRLKMQDLKARHGTIWAVNTGRGIGNFKRVFQPMRSLGILPDFVIVSHAYAYGIRNWYFKPHYLWNLQILFFILKNRAFSRRMIKQCHKTIKDRFRRVRTLHMNSESMRLGFRDSATMESASYLLRIMSESYRNLMVFEHVTDILVRSVPFTKGLAVSHLAKHLNIPTSQILTVGDGLNDLSMLDRSVAAMTACPANAIAEVIEQVHHNGGHIAVQPMLTGTLEAISAFDSGNVRSNLPENWDAQKGSRRIMDSDDSRAKHHGEGRIAREIAIFCVVVLAILIALASVGMLGPLSAPVMKIVRPLEWAAENIGKMIYR